MLLAFCIPILSCFSQYYLVPYVKLSFFSFWQGGFILDMGVHFIAGLRMVIFKILLSNSQTILFINLCSSVFPNAIYVAENSDYHWCSKIKWDFLAYES